MSPTGPERKTKGELPILIEPAELSVRTWLRLGRIYNRSVRRLGQALDRHGLSLAQFEVLAVLGLREGMTQQELAFRLEVTKGNICGMIDRMAASGWVERRPDAEDRRANRLFLTGPGRRLLAETISPHHALIGAMMGALNEAEIRTLHQLLERLEAGLGEEPA